MKYAESLIDLVGDTPLVKLQHVTAGIAATVLVKLEYLNPGGSSKDRIAVRMIDAAEREDKLRPGGTIVEPTSGNTGVALAMVAQQRGYRCVFVCPDKVGEDKRNVLTALGAEVVVTPTAVPPESPESYYSVSDRLAREIPGAFKPDQYSNPNGPLSHYETTGPEIWRDTDGQVSHFVAGIGTGGTITGAGRYLREVSGDRVKIIGADPEGSVYAGGVARPYLVEGVGEDMWPAAYDTSVPHEIVSVSDAESFAMTHRLAREEGILVGGSSGMAVVAALRAAATAGSEDVFVVLLPDSGRGYLGKIFNTDWLRSRGFQGAATAERAELTARELLRSDGARTSLAFARPSDTVEDAIRVMADAGLRELPVFTTDPPVLLGEVVGAISEETLLEALTAGSIRPDDQIATIVGPGFSLVGADEAISAVTALFEAAGQEERPRTLLVIDNGRVLGAVTRRDLLSYLSSHNPALHQTSVPHSATKDTAP